MRTGQVGGYGRIRRRIEGLIDDRVHDTRRGTSDPEAIFLAALSSGFDDDPSAAFASVLGTILALQRAQGIRAPLRLAACFTDGRAPHASRWASDDRSPTLYLRRLEDAVPVVSEPYDDDRDAWEAVPADSCVRVGPSLGLEVVPFRPRVATAAPTH